MECWYSPIIHIKALNMKNKDALLPLVFKSLQFNSFKGFTKCIIKNQYISSYLLVKLEEIIGIAFPKSVLYTSENSVVIMRVCV